MNNQRVNVTWQNFLELYCTFEGGQMEKHILIKFWQKFFDQSMTGVCPEAHYMKLLEELIRGIALQKKNKTTHLFAQMY